MSIRITVWNENFHEQSNPAIKEIYPDGIHNAIKDFLEKEPGMTAVTATLDMPEHGLTDEVLNNTDVLIWWGHLRHGNVSDETVAKVHKRVLEGMGLIALHSSHLSKIFRVLTGTGCRLHWGPEQKEIMWNIMPNHPITKDIPEYFIIDKEEMYGEPFDIPAPDELIFMSWFEQGNVFRSGCVYRRGHGKVFYFQPGHETVPTYYNPYVQKIIVNAVRWAVPDIIKTPFFDFMPVDFHKE